MKKPKFAHRSDRAAAEAAEPFDTAEEAWFWAMSCLVAREDGARFVAGLGLQERPCSPDDLIVSAERMGASGRLKPLHLRVLAGYAPSPAPPRAASAPTTAGNCWRICARSPSSAPAARRPPTRPCATSKASAAWSTASPP